MALSSFAEGVDLPGKYCTHVLIAKIPFAVPNDPIELTLSAWIEQQGLNSFMTLAVPRRGFPARAGERKRLLRSESDRGTITLFDERIVSRALREDDPGIYAALQARDIHAEEGRASQLRRVANELMVLLLLSLSVCGPTGGD